METVIALKEAMQRVGIRNADVARACDISPQAVHQWFAKGTVSRHHLMTAARLCGTTLDELEGKPSQPTASAMDLETLKRAIQHVKEVTDREGKSKDITPEALAEMVVFSYEKLVLAKQAELAVDQKISEMLQSTKTVPPTSK